MCLLAVACGVSERYPLVIAANRDERHDRPALAIHWWHERQQIFGGRDLAASGSWLAVDRSGRFAAVTNVREARSTPARRSRGHLVAEFLSGAQSADQFAALVDATGDDYGPFNLLLFDGETLLVASNRAPQARLGPGVHALSNSTLGAAWPKLAVAREGVRAALAHGDPTEALLETLATRSASADLRPEASVFIAGETFGTRSSAVILIDADRRLSFTERRFGPSGAAAGESWHRFALERQAPILRAASHAPISRTSSAQTE